MLSSSRFNLEAETTYVAIDVELSEAMQWLEVVHVMATFSRSLMFRGRFSKSDSRSLPNAESDSRSDSSSLPNRIH